MPQYDLNLREYLRIFRKRSYAIIAVFLPVTLGSALYLSSQPAHYRADATIKIEERKTIAGMLTEWIMFNPGDIMETHTQTIKAYPVLKRTAEEIGLLAPQADTEAANAAVSALQGQIETERVSRTNMIRIIATADTPKKAMDMANTVARVYIDENMREKSTQARQVRSFIEEQLASLETQLKRSEEKLSSFSEQVRNISLSGPIQSRLVDLQFSLAELLQQYTEKHPKVLQLQEQISRIESQLTTMSSQELEYTRISREIEVNKKLFSMLKEKLEEAKINDAQRVEDITVVNPAFLPQVPVSSAIHGAKLLTSAFVGLLLGLTVAFILEALDTSLNIIKEVKKNREGR
jgi:uncharacterized protein involved in exopolysaccharide biosynthesis